MNKIAPLALLRAVDNPNDCFTVSCAVTRTAERNAKILTPCFFHSEPLASVSSYLILREVNYHLPCFKLLWARSDRNKAHKRNPLNPRTLRYCFLLWMSGYTTNLTSTLKALDLLRLPRCQTALPLRCGRKTAPRVASLQTPFSPRRLIRERQAWIIWTLAILVIGKSSRKQACTCGCCSRHCLRKWS